MRLKFYFSVMAAGLVICCSQPLAADTWSNPVIINFGGDARYDHECPAITATGNKLFFSSDSDDGIANGAFDLYYSIWQDTAWSAPVFLSLVINGMGDSIETSPAIGCDDTTLYFVRQDTIYRSYFTGGVWQPPEKLFSGGGPFIAKDGTTLYFHAPGYYGGKDIWMTREDSPGLWTTPVVLDSIVNTSADETEPSIAGNDTDFVFCRSSGYKDTMNIWHCKLNTGDAAECLFYSHYDSILTFSNYWYRSPCISYDGQKIYFTNIPFTMEPMSDIYVSERITGVDGKPEDRIPNIEFRMVQNSPNPFSSQTTIKYQIPKSGVVSLKVYNIQGQLVTILDNGYRLPGYYEIKWDGRDEQGRAAGNGVYFCKLNCNGQTQSKKIILMR